MRNPRAGREEKFRIVSGHHHTFLILGAKGSPVLQGWQLPWAARQLQGSLDSCAAWLCPQQSFPRLAALALGPDGPPLERGFGRASAAQGSPSSAGHS